MQILDVVIEALRGVRGHPLRSFLTLLGIIIGVTTVVGVVGVISGLDHYVKETVINLAPDVFVVTRFGIILSRDEFLEALKRKEIDWHEYETLTRLLTKAQSVAALAGNNVTARYQGRRLEAVNLIGTTANAAPLLGLDLYAGRFYLDAEAQANQPVAVIGWDLKEELFPNVDPIGRTVTFEGVPFRVIGLVTKQGRVLGQSRDQQAFIPLTAFGQYFGSRNSLDLLVRARGGVPGVSAAVEETRTVMRAVRHTSFKGPDPFSIVTSEAALDLWKAISRASFILMFLISTVSLGVGGVVIMNIMLVAVLERTPEIGVRLAVGARPADIRRQFLLEATVLSVFGGLVGVLFGTLAALAVGQFTSFPARISPGIALLGLALSAFVGMVSGFWPAFRASRLQAVEALRTE